MPLFTLLTALAISNGWGVEYLQLAAAFDKAYASFPVS